MNGFSPEQPTPPWWRRITGRRALSWQVVVFGTLLTYPQIVLTGGTLGSRTVQPDEFPTIAAVTAGAVVVAVSYAGIAQLTFMRNRAIRPIPLWVYVTFYMTAGFIYAAGMEISDEILGAEAVIPWPIRFLFAGVTTVGWGVIVSLILDSRDRFRETRDDLLQRNVDVELASLRESMAAQEIRAMVDEEVRANLSHGRAELQSILGARAATAVLSADSRAEAEIASLLRRTAQDSVRSLSHRLLAQAEAENPRPRVAGVLRQFIAHPRFLPSVTALLVGLGLPGAAIRAVGAAWAPLAVIGMAGLTFLLLALGDRLITSLPRVRHVTYVVVFLAMNIAVFAFALIPGEETTRSADASAIIIGVTTAVVAASLVRANSEVRRLALDSLQNELDANSVSSVAYQQELALALTETARALHGSVQTRLMVCAGAIEQASRERDQAAIDRAITEALDVLGQEQQLSKYTGDVGADLAEAVALWEPMCDITVAIADDVASMTERPDIALVVEEALANAYRHGRAESIVLVVESRPSGVLVTVTDDGVGPQGGATGLGMAMMRRLTGGKVTLESLQPGARLVAQLP